MAAGAATPAQVRVAAFHWQTASLTSSRLLGFHFGAGTCRAPMNLHPHKLGINSRLVFLSYQKIPAPGSHTILLSTLLLFDLPAIKKHKDVAVQPSASPLFSLGVGSGWLGGAREAAEKSSGRQLATLASGFSSSWDPSEADLLGGRGGLSGKDSPGWD